MVRTWISLLGPQRSQLSLARVSSGEVWDSSRWKVSLIEYFLSLLSFLVVSITRDIQGDGTVGYRVGLVGCFSSQFKSTQCHVFPVMCWAVQLAISSQSSVMNASVFLCAIMSVGWELDTVFWGISGFPLCTFLCALYGLTFRRTKHGNLTVVISMFPRMEIPQVFWASVPVFDYPRYDIFYLIGISLVPTNIHDLSSRKKLFDH